MTLHEQSTLGLVVIAVTVCLIAGLALGYWVVGRRGRRS
jgi:uncharacterized protein YneF (UPF0154 family)